MKEFKSLKDISRERVCELADRAVKKFQGAVLPIYGSTHQGTPEHIGSCIALRLQGSSYLLTAAHVIDWNEDTSLYVGCPSLHQISMIFSSTEKPDGDRDQDHYDFAISKLSDEDVRAWGDLKFITEEEIDLSNNDWPGNTYTAVGYLNSKNKKVDHRNRTISARLYHYSNIAKEDAGLAQKLGVSGSDHVFIGFNAKYSQDTEGKRVSSVKLNGLSGGAIINLGNLADSRVLAGCVDPKPRLSGVFIEFHSDHAAIVATKIGPILRAIGIIAS